MPAKIEGPGRGPSSIRYFVLLGLVALVLTYGAATQDRELVRAFMRDIGMPLVLLLVAGGTVVRRLAGGDKVRRRGRRASSPVTRPPRLDARCSSSVGSSRILFARSRAHRSLPRW